MQSPRGPRKPHRTEIPVVDPMVLSTAQLHSTWYADLPFIKQVNLPFLSAYLFCLEYIPAFLRDLQFFEIAPWTSRSTAKPRGPWPPKHSWQAPSSLPRASRPIFFAPRQSTSAWRTKFHTMSRKSKIESSILGTVKLCYVLGRVSK